MQLMSIEDLAAYLGDSKRTIYKYIASGDCPPYIRISSKNIKFDRADVDAWLESKKVYAVPGGKNKLPWTPRAQAVLKQARKQARKDSSDFVGTEHIVFGIVSVKGCLGAKILENLGVTPSIYYQRYEQLCSPSDERDADKAGSSGDIDKVIQCACEQAGRWGHKYIGAEHLLVGVLLAGTGIGFRILAELGITLEKVCEETAKLIVCRAEPPR